MAFPKIFLSFFIFVLIFIFIYLLSVIRHSQSDFCRPSCQEIIISRKKIKIKIAKSEAEITKGLSGVKKIAKDEGMLFILPKKQIPVFWMKDMRFNLDFIWISEAKVVDLTQNLPAPKKNFTQPARCWPKIPVDMVLETNSGFIQENHISLNDPIIFIEKSNL